MGEKGKTEWFMSYRQKHIQRGESSEKQVDMAGLIVIQGHSDVWAWAQVWIHDHDAAEVCVDVCGS